MIRIFLVFFKDVSSLKNINNRRSSFINYRGFLIKVNIICDILDKIMSYYLSPDMIRMEFPLSFVEPYYAFDIECATFYTIRFPLNFLKVPRYNAGLSALLQKRAWREREWVPPGNYPPLPWELSSAHLFELHLPNPCTLKLYAPLLIMEGRGKSVMSITSLINITISPTCCFR